MRQLVARKRAHNQSALIPIEHAAAGEVTSRAPWARVLHSDFFLFRLGPDRTIFYLFVRLEIENKNILVLAPE